MLPRGSRGAGARWIDALLSFALGAMVTLLAVQMRGGGAGAGGSTALRARQAQDLLGRCDAALQDALARAKSSQDACAQQVREARDKAVAAASRGRKSKDPASRECALALADCEAKLRPGVAALQDKIQALDRAYLINTYHPERSAIVLLNTSSGEILLETAPFTVMPHAVRYFLSMVESGYWDGCHFLRNAVHVIQGNCNGRQPRHQEHQSIAFQEYSPEFKHVAFTFGIAGRPGGPDFYISLVDNVRNHGPGGQGPEADPCFARLLGSRATVDRMHASMSAEWSERSTWVRIEAARVLRGEAAKTARAAAAAISQGDAS